MKYKHQLKSISDDELLRRLSALLQQSRRVESELVAHIGEVDKRRLYAREASSSMFVYCTDVLHLSEHEAYLRIQVARASRHHPMLLTMLEDGRLQLSSIAKLAPHLTKANREALLARATHKTKREIEELVAELSPKPDVPAAMRKLPVRQEKKTESKPSFQLGPDRVEAPEASSKEPTAAVQPLSPARYKIQFTASAELKDKLERLKALMRSSIPDGDLAAVIEEAVTEKLERLESKRFGKTNAPRKSLAETDTSTGSRYIPAAVKRAVRERDGDQCRFVNKHGRRCKERDQLEYHHRQPFARRGDRKPENIQLMCTTHNAYLADCGYGKDVMEQYRRPPNRVSEPAPVYFASSCLTKKPRPFPSISNMLFSVLE